MSLLKITKLSSEKDYLFSRHCQLVFNTYRLCPTLLFHISLLPKGIWFAFHSELLGGFPRMNLNAIIIIFHWLCDYEVYCLGSAVDSIPNWTKGNSNATNYTAENVGIYAKK